MKIVLEMKLRCFTLSPSNSYAIDVIATIIQHGFVTCKPLIYLIVSVGKIRWRAGK
jgi:hypothetical protein